MGYYTQFEFQFRPAEARERFEAALDNSVASDEFKAAALCGSAKWYDHEDDIKRASLLCPGDLIIVDGYGESAGDCWRKFFKDGKVEEVRWEPPEDPSDL